jgi:hypothetical protein
MSRNAAVRCAAGLRRVLVASLAVAAALVASSRGLDLNAAETPARAASFFDVMAWQAALEAKGFSPGLVDGLDGPKTALATRAFQSSCGLEMTGRLDEATAAALEVGAAPAVLEYAVLPDDERQVSYCPPDWNEKSRRRKLLYLTLSSCIAEKFHTSERCLASLNPQADLAALKAGDVLRVPCVRERKSPTSIESMEIDLSRKLVLLLDGAKKVTGLLHCSVAKDLSRVERGEAKVSTVVKDPEYTFDPEKWPEVKNVKKKLLIPAGPRCPVGVRWIGLDRSGVGVHGTAEPENIGKTGSHGCFRLTNWDAVYLASRAYEGLPVRIVDSSPLAASLDG